MSGFQEDHKTGFTMRMMKPTKIVPSLAFSKIYKSGGDDDSENDSPRASKRNSRPNIATLNSHRSGNSLRGEGDPHPKIVNHRQMIN